MFLWRIPALTAVLVLAAPTLAALEVVYVTRHAQKQDPWPGDDRSRPLTGKGKQCATARAEWLRERVEAEPERWRPVAAVYATDFERTKATGEAVSRAFPGADVTGDDGTIEPSEAWVARVKDEEHGDDPAIFVVGHSNTVDDLVLAFRPDARECLKKLQMSHPDGIQESRYGELWVVELDGEGCEGLSREAPLDDCATK